MHAELVAADGTPSWHCLLPQLRLMPNVHAEDGGQCLLSLVAQPPQSPPATAAVALAEPQPDGLDWLRCSHSQSAATVARVHSMSHPKASREPAQLVHGSAAANRPRLLVRRLCLVLTQPSPHWLRCGIRGLCCYGLVGPGPAEVQAAADSDQPQAAQYQQLLRLRQIATQVASVR